jgi:hypothetical protein
MPPVMPPGGIPDVPQWVDEDGLDTQWRWCWHAAAADAGGLS